MLCAILRVSLISLMSNVGLNFATIRPAIVPNAATNRLEWGVAPTAPARTSTVPANWLPTEFATRRVPTSTDRFPKWLPTTATVWERLQINNLLGYSLGCRLVFFSTDTRELLVSVPLFVYACMVPLQILLMPTVVNHQNKLCCAIMPSFHVVDPARTNFHCILEIRPVLSKSELLGTLKNTLSLDLSQHM